MWNLLRAAAAFIERRTDDIGKLAALTGLAMILLVAVNVVLRYSLSLGSVWAQELEWHLLAALIQLGMAHALLRGGEVRVDLFYQHYPPAAKRAVDVVAALLMVGVCVLFVALSLGYVEQARAIGEASSDPGGLPQRWLVKALIPLGFGLVLLQQLGLLVRLLDPATPGHGAAAKATAQEGGHA
ncbi:TRAP transporter small permease subunit [Aquabacterium sp. OR-4]|uniref:TRAP transporter small permease subunit n=1 Tax=Aquabacterium sp. OR-4 TaxID=2978127 RepID=UPI0028C52FC5|nr:TRAP transporter small permease subunit [Aquabacterium sp. OR-4]MDT7838157.1 TRAP transporter small permease subunit [Aquabacterium sp. OR-4]